MWLTKVKFNWPLLAKIGLKNGKWLTVILSSVCTVSTDKKHAIGLGPE